MLLIIEVRTSGKSKRKFVKSTSSFQHANASSGLPNGMMMAKAPAPSEHHQQLHGDMKPLAQTPHGLAVQITPSATAAPPTSTGNFLRPSPAGESAAAPSWPSHMVRMKIFFNFRDIISFNKLSESLLTRNFQQDDTHQPAQPSTSSAMTTAPPAGPRRNRRKADLSQEASPQDDEIIMATADSLVVGGGRSQGRKNNNGPNSNFSSSTTPLTKQNSAEGRKVGRIRLLIYLRSNLDVLFF